MGLFQDIKDFFSGGSSKPSSSAPSIDTDSAVSAVVNEGGSRTYTGGIRDDLTMGLSTFGLSGEAQAEKLAEQGWSPGAIEDFQARTAETKANPPSFPKDDKPAAVTSTPEKTDTTDTTDTAATGTVLDQTTDAALDTVEDISKKTFTKTANFSPSVSVGKAEDEALEFMKKGKKATILTKPGGLLGTGEEEGQTRRRRSLIGG